MQLNLQEIDTQIIGIFEIKIFSLYQIIMTLMWQKSLYLESGFIMGSWNKLMFLMALKSCSFIESNGVTKHKKLQGRVKQRSKCQEQQHRKDDQQALPIPQAPFETLRETIKASQLFWRHTWGSVLKQILLHRARFFFSLRFHKTW